MPPVLEYLDRNGERVTAKIPGDVKISELEQQKRRDLHPLALVLTLDKKVSERMLFTLQKALDGTVGKALSLYVGGPEGSIKLNGNTPNTYIFDNTQLIALIVKRMTFYNRTKKQKARA